MLLRCTNHSTRSLRLSSTFLNRVRPPSLPTPTPRLQLVQKSPLLSSLSTSTTLAQPLKHSYDPPSPSHLKTLIIRNLQRRQPRRALHLLLTSLSSPHPSSNPQTLKGILSLFLKYKHTSLVIEAVEKLHKMGYKVPISISIGLLGRVLQESPKEVDMESMRVMVDWVQNGVSDDSAGESMDQGLVKLVMETLRRNGQLSWLESVFNAYCGSLPEGSTPPAELWSVMIMACGQDGDLNLAEKAFEQWRELYRNFPSTTPPETPYLSLIRLHSLFPPPPSQPRESDPGLYIISLLSTDSVPISPTILSALMHFELSRHYYRSFWSLWNEFNRREWTRPPSSWRYAVKCLSWQTTSSNPSRLRGSFNSPLPKLLPFPLYPSSPPSSRELFSLLLHTTQIETSSRPSLHLHSPTLSTPLLNSFLRLFIAQQDFPAARLVLESFKVHKKNPDEGTHKECVLGVTRLWSEGRLVLGVGNGMGKGRRGTDEIGGEIERELGIEEEGEKRKTEEEEMKFISSILSHRRRPLTSLSSPNDDEEPTRLPPNAWMIRRETRDLGYLQKLLMRCEGGSEDLWREKMRRVRGEVLPVKKERERGRR